MPPAVLILEIADLLNIPVTFLLGRDDAISPAPAIRELVHHAESLSGRDLQLLVSFAKTMARTT